MEFDLDLLITEILRIMAAEDELDDEDKERLYRKIFDSEMAGVMYEQK